MIRGLLQLLGRIPPEGGPMPLVQRSPQWTTFRNRVITEDGACAACGCTENLEVHHKKPLHLYAPLELERSNVMVLCRVHHLWLGHLGSWFAWNPSVVADTHWFRDKVKHRPTGPVG